MVIRTCVGCRQRADKSTLVRVVARREEAEWSALPDVRGTLPGRGAYLHPSPECLDLAIRRRAFGRALRIEGRITTEALGAQFAQDQNQST
ncbi:YlxR family protein [Aeromicrobium phragmitis]|uniref:YlxR family protein n=1 Tax=Aeromicrobium phragmitis TaxID=2478914 RepID=A0A3L8PRH7_9ACTN|nr:YlxR family protein [Aeromicrobium phragmitis]RLV56988.1 YlxR family protein [Aeromicrobium phragmitis]